MTHAPDLPTRAERLTPHQARQVLQAANDGTLAQLGFPTDQLADLYDILEPVRTLDTDGNLAVPLDVLVRTTSLVDAVAAAVATA